jgi:hypothetical protein
MPCDGGPQPCNLSGFACTCVSNKWQCITTSVGRSVCGCSYGFDTGPDDAGPDARDGG